MIKPTPPEGNRDGKQYLKRSKRTLNEFEQQIKRNKLFDTGISLAEE